MKKVLFAIVGVTLMLNAISNAMANQLQDIQTRGMIRVAVAQDFPPFGFVGTDMQSLGYDIDVARYIANQLKLHLKLVPVSSSNRVQYLQTDKVDLVISSMGKNAEREKVIAFSHAYAPFFLGIFGQKGEKLKDLAALNGKSIGLTRGAIEDMVISDIIPDAYVKRYEDQNTTLAAYSSGQVQYVATGNLLVSAISRQKTEKAPVVHFMLQNSPCFIGLKKDEPVLKAKINTLIEQAIKNGTLNKLSQKWLKVPLPANLSA